MCGIGTDYWRSPLKPSVPQGDWSSLKENISEFLFKQQNKNHSSLYPYFLLKSRKIRHRVNRNCWKTKVWIQKANTWTRSWCAYYHLSKRSESLNVKYYCRYRSAVSVANVIQQVPLAGGKVTITTSVASNKPKRSTLLLLCHRLKL